MARLVEHYNLDAALAVGCRVRSVRGTASRQRATAHSPNSPLVAYLRQAAHSIDCTMIFLNSGGWHETGSWPSAKYTHRAL